MRTDGTSQCAETHQHSWGMVGPFIEWHVFKGCLVLLWLLQMLLLPTPPIHSCDVPLLLQETVLSR